MPSTRANRDGGPRALSLGSCDRLSPDRALICANGRGNSVVGCGRGRLQRGSPPDLVRLWCARLTGTGLGTAHRETGGVAEDRAGPRSFPAAGAVGGGSRVVGGQLHLLHP